MSHTHSDGLLTKPCLHRDNDATAPAEFPPEQPEADLAVEEEYGADEVDLEEDLEEGAVETNGEGSAANGNGEDAAMAGEQVLDDEMSEDGSVDLEGESEDDEEEQEQEQEEGAAPDGGDEMDVDMGDAPDGPSQPELMAH